jgi:hypothetical protein
MPPKAVGKPSNLAEQEGSIPLAISPIKIRRF